MSDAVTKGKSACLACLTLAVFALALTSCKQRSLDTAALHFEEAGKDFGQLPKGQDVVNHDFLFRNTGDKPLAIIKVVTQCSCVTTRVPKEPVPPGAAGTISARFKLASITGPQTTSLLVYSDDPRRPITRLSLTASVKVDIAVSTEKIDLGRLAVGQNGGAGFYVVVPCRPEQTPADLVSFETSSPSLSVTVASVQKRFNQWDGLVQVVNCHATYSAAKVPGPVAEKIIVACVGKPLRKEIQVCAKIVGLVVAEPESILLPRLEGTAPIDKTVVIRSTNSELPPIDKIVCSCEAITADAPESNADHHLLHIRIEPTKLKAGIVREEVQIRMGNPEQSVLRVPILAWQEGDAT
jgi:hypothetical protein